MSPCVESTTVVRSGSGRPGTAALASAHPTGRIPPVSEFHEFQMQSIQGDQVSFDTYEDQVSLIVNVASR